MDDQAIRRLRTGQANLRAHQLAEALIRRGILTPSAAHELRQQGDPETFIERLLRREALSPDQLAELRREAELNEIFEAVTPSPLPAEVEAALADTVARVGKFVLVKLLGRGGMGDVWKGWDSQLRRWVALKFLRDYEEEGDPQLLKRFFREANLVSQLSHPGIVRIYEVEMNPRKPYIAMEYIEGRSFEGAKLGRRRAAEIVRDAARAVQYAHERGIIHRDLKPANLMEGVEGRILVMDFGLARPVGKGKTLTVDGDLLGTPAFMAPEQARGAAAGVCTDVYGLGATLYALLEGRTPYQGEDNYQIVHLVATAPTPPLSVQDELSVIVGKAMERESRDRYASARELADDLDRYLQGEPIRAHPPSVWTVLGRRLKKRKGVVGAVLVAVAAAALLATFGATAFLKKRTFEQSRTKAHQAYEAGNWEAALAESERALEIRPDPGLAQLRTACRERISEQALREKVRPLELLIQDTRPFFYVPGTDVFEKLKQIRQALMELEPLAKDTTDPRVGSVLGSAWYLIGDDRRAEQALLQVLRKDSSDGTANFYLGRLYLERAAVDPFYLQNIRPDAERFDELGQWLAKALECLRRVRNPGGEEIDRIIIQAYGAAAEGDLKELERLCEEGLRRFPDKIGSEEFHILRAYRMNWKDAVQEYDLAIRRRPHYAVALFMRGWCRHALRDLEGARADYDRALQLNPNKSLLYHNRGLVRSQLKDLDGAMADYDQAIRLREDLAEAWNARGLLKHALGDPKGALADLDRAVELQDRYTTAYVNRGMVKKFMGDATGARKDIDKVLEIDPKNAWGYYYRGFLQHEEGKLEGAIVDFNQAIQCDPSLAQAYLERGYVRLAKGDLDLATADFDTTIELEKYPQAYYGRGSVRWKRQDRKGAIEDFTFALTLRPDYADAYGMRGVVKDEMEDLAGAMEDYNRAIALKTSLPDVYYARGFFKVQAKDAAGAVADFEQALKVAPPSWPLRGDAEEAIRRLRKGP